MQYRIQYPDGPGSYQELPAGAFFEEIEAVCIKYGLSITQEDMWGTFIIDVYCPEHCEWLADAIFTSAAAHHLLKSAL